MTDARRFFGLLLILATGSFSTSGAEQGIKVLRSINWQQHEKAEHFVFQTEQQFGDVWLKDGGRYGNTPLVDFQSETVLAIFAGPQNTGGYSIRIEWCDSYAKSGDPKAPVDTYLFGYRIVKPAADAIVTQAITYPSYVIVVPKLRGNISFVDVESEVGKALAREHERRRDTLKNLEETNKQLAKIENEKKNDTDANVQKRLKKLGIE